MVRREDTIDERQCGSHTLFPKHCRWKLFKVFFLIHLLNCVSMRMQGEGEQNLKVTTVVFPKQYQGSTFSLESTVSPGY